MDIKICQVPLLFLPVKRYNHPMIYLVATAAIIVTLLGGLFAIRFRDKLHLILGFSAGAVMAVALFDLLPESIELVGPNYSIQEIALLIAGGFALYLILDRFFSLHKHDDCCKESHQGNFGSLAIILHSVFDGFGIGLAFKISPEVGGVVALAILAHRFSDGINTVGLSLKSSADRKRALSYVLAVAIAPALGIVATIFISVSEITLGMIMAVFTGLFLYLGASDLIPESHHQHPTIWTTIMTILGMAIMYGVIRIAG